MIAAILANGLTVQVDDTDGKTAQVTNLGRRNLDSHYVGGQGFVGTKTTYVPAETIEVIAQFDEDCDEYQNWLAAMRESDALADDRSPNTQAALDIEAEAQKLFVEFIHKNSVAPGTHAREISPKYAELPPAFQFWEGEFEDICSSGVALQGQGR